MEPYILEAIDKAYITPGDVWGMLDGIALIYGMRHVSWLAKRHNNITIKAWGVYNFNELFYPPGFVVVVETDKDKELAKEIYKHIPKEKIKEYIKSKCEQAYDFDKFEVSKNYFDYQGVWGVYIWDKDIPIKHASTIRTLYKVPIEYNNMLLSMHKHSFYRVITT